MVIAVPTSARPDANSSDVFKGSSWILHERARKHHWSGIGSLSIKCFFSGRAQYKVGCGHHAVDDSSYLVLNEGQRYEIEIDSRQPVESFCLFFAPGLVTEVQRSLSCRPEVLLDNPEAEQVRPVRFFEKNYTHDDVLSPAIQGLRSTHTNEEGGKIAERFHWIVERLL